MFAPDIVASSEKTITSQSGTETSTTYSSVWNVEQHSEQELEFRNSKEAASVNINSLTQSSSTSNFIQNPLSISSCTEEGTAESDYHKKPKLKIKKKLKPDKAKRSEESEEGSSSSHGRKEMASQVPMCAAMFVATALGTPAIALMGLKLGMAAGLGGGMMGFATGRMFAENEYDHITYE